MSAALTRKVLIVEDDVELRNLLCSVAADHGFDVTAVADGDEALQAIDRGHYPVILLDMRLPRLGGSDVLTLLRYVASPEHVHVIVCTARHDVTEEMVHEAGAQTLLRKPFNIHELEHALDVAADNVA